MRAALLLLAMTLPAQAGRFPAAEKSIEGKTTAKSAALASAAYYNPDGSFLKWKGPASWDSPVVIAGEGWESALTSNASDKPGLPISVRDFLNRAHRVCGEGKGWYADHYAHAQDNIREAKGGTEKDNFYAMSNYAEKLNEGKGAFPSYEAFYEAKKDLELSKLDEVTGAKASIKAVIDLLQASGLDPTNGATQWRGADLSAYDAKKAELERAKTDGSVLEGWGLTGVYVKEFQVLKSASRIHMFFSVTKSPPN